MTPRDFCYWLQGSIEINEEIPNQRQWDIIKNHLNLVFKHSIDGPDPDGSLQETHDGTNNPLKNRPPGARC